MERLDMPSIELSLFESLAAKALNVESTNESTKLSRLFKWKYLNFEFRSHCAELVDCDCRNGLIVQQESETFSCKWGTRMVSTRKMLKFTLGE